jgi:hypothetical protein
MLRVRRLLNRHARHTTTTARRTRTHERRNDWDNELRVFVFSSVRQTAVESNAEKLYCAADCARAIRPTPLLREDFLTALAAGSDLTGSRRILVGALLVGVNVWLGEAAFEPFAQPGHRPEFFLVSRSFDRLAIWIGVTAGALLAVHAVLVRLRGAPPRGRFLSAENTRYLRLLWWTALFFVPLANLSGPLAGRLHGRRQRDHVAVAVRLRHAGQEAHRDGAMIARENFSRQLSMLSVSCLDGSGRKVK